MTIDAITLNDMLKSSRIDDLDKALLPLQVIAGIDAGDVAAQVFAGFDWYKADLAQRMDRLFVWIKAERAHLDSDGAPFTVEHYAALAFLMQSLEDLGFSQHLPRVMDNARLSMAALRNAYPICAQYEQQKQKIARLG